MSEPGPLTEAQLAVITEARLRARRVRRAAVVASISGGTLLCFAGLTGLLAIFNPLSFLLAIALGVVAMFELRGAAGLRRFELTAPRRLAINQGLLAVFVCGWYFYSMLMSLFGPGPYDAYLAGSGPQAETFASIDRLHRFMSLVFQVVVISGTLLATSGAAWYYASRRRHMQAWIDETPEWAARAIVTAS